MASWLNLTSFIVVMAWLIAAVLLFIDEPEWIFYPQTVGIGWLIGGVFRLLHGWAERRYPERYRHRAPA